MTTDEAAERIQSWALHGVEFVMIWRRCEILWNQRECVFVSTHPVADAESVVRSHTLYATPFNGPTTLFVHPARTMIGRISFDTFNDLSVWLPSRKMAGEAWEIWLGERYGADAVEMISARTSPR